MATETLKRIGTVLLERGFITEEQLNTALKIQSGTSKKVGDILVETGIITEEQLVEVVAERLNIPKLNLSSMVINPQVINLIPVEMAKRFHVIPVFMMGNILTVAMADPLDVIAIDEIKYHTKCVIKRTVAGKTALTMAIDQYYSVADSVRDILGDDDEGDAAEADTASSTDMLDAFADGDSTVVKLVNMIITRAIKDNASDVHFEPDENELRIRYRVNGVMREEASPPKKLQPEIISRIKIASNLDVSEKRIPQDGRMAIRVDGSEIDLRVSTLPTIHGEKVVIRILDKRNLSTGLNDLGMNANVLDIWRTAIHTPEGLILITGPTSSGKTSTLYASLQEINSVEKNIITVEDPVEFSLPLINQVQINEKAKLTFASALRAMLRQNPDIIMVGEIRDTETGAIAVRAALTGHLVFSTLHTNDSIGTIARLLDMGIEPYMVASALEAILAQRLVRTICEDCKDEFEPSPAVIKKAFPNGAPPDMKYYQGVGCRQCRNTGYAGLTGLFELVKITERLREMILSRSSESVIKAEAYRNGYRPLFDSGVELVRQGVTTLDEILKVTSSMEIGEAPQMQAQPQPLVRETV
ncbi:MAG: ATPase, T2SS/T4P/T4SS family [Candidatus Zixiibacteriota bacterium]